MTDRMDLISPKTLDSGKTIFRKVGVAFPRKNGDGWVLQLELIPIPDKDGEIRLMMMAPRQTSGAYSSGEASLGGGDTGSRRTTARAPSQTNNQKAWDQEKTPWDQ